MKKSLFALMLFAVASTFAGERPSLTIKSIDKLGGFKARYNLVLKQSDGVKCLLLQNNRDEVNKLCNPEDDFAFSVTKSFKTPGGYMTTPEKDMITFKNVMLQYEDGRFESLGEFSKNGTQPWTKAVKASKTILDGFEYEVIQIDERQVVTSLHYRNKKFKAFERDYEIKFNVSPEVLRGVSCIYVYGPKNVIAPGNYSRWGWEVADKIEICDSDNYSLANKLNSLKYEKEVLIVPVVDDKSFLCGISGCLFNRIVPTGEYEADGGIDSFTIYLLMESGERVDVNLDLFK